MKPKAKTEYIANLQATNGDGLKGNAIKLFTRLRQAKAEGDTAVDGADRLRVEIKRLESMANNRQGRFEATADLLYESYIEGLTNDLEDPPTPSGDETADAEETVED